MTGFVDVRAYAELNDFLPAARRHRDFDAESAADASLKHVIETHGVPHTEVELILVNGEAVGFAHRPGSGDRISVYPKFEAFDVTPLLRLRPRPLRQTRFIADAHLGDKVGDMAGRLVDTMVPTSPSRS